MDNHEIKIPAFFYFVAAVSAGSLVGLGITLTRIAIALEALKP